VSLVFGLTLKFKDKKYTQQCARLSNSSENVRGHENDRDRPTQDFEFLLQELVDLYNVHKRHKLNEVF
jgi:hypothetical protein